ncbi:MAG: ECF-type sigma factor [Lysobacter sp.]
MPATPDTSAGDVTRLLNALQPDGDRGIDAQDRDEVFTHVYGALHRIARQQRARWHGNETLNATALVHEAYLKLVSLGASYENRSHFLAVASKAMRQLLINYAQRHAAQKRGSGEADLSLDEALLISEQRGEELLALDEALKQLQLMDPRAAQVVECRVFGGLSAEETAEALGVTRRTVSRDWSAARAWLYGELRADLTGPTS